MCSGTEKLMLMEIDYLCNWLNKNENNIYE